LAGGYATRPERRPAAWAGPADRTTRDVPAPHTRSAQTLDDIHPAHLRYHPDDELIFLFRVRTGNRKEVLRCLQNAGPTVKILLNRSVTFWGNTALHIAYKRKDMEMVKLLLHYGADATILNDWDQPAIPAGELVRLATRFERMSYLTGHSQPMLCPLASYPIPPEPAAAALRGKRLFDVVGEHHARVRAAGPAGRQVQGRVSSLLLSFFPLFPSGRPCACLLV